MTFSMMSKAEFIRAGADATVRARDNSGTYVVDPENRIIGFVRNCENEDGVWLYYSSDVREWLGLTRKADGEVFA